ncbi:MAG: hypothetical protein WCR71_04175 [Bacteroidales bacterium]
MEKQINEMYAQINEHKNYLKDTDYKAIKEAEIGVRMDEAVRDRRQQARDEINRLEYEIELLTEQLEEQKNEQSQEVFHEDTPLR